MYSITHFFLICQLRRYQLAMRNRITEQIRSIITCYHFPPPLANRSCAMQTVRSASLLSYTFNTALYVSNVYHLYEPESPDPGQKPTFREQSLPLLRLFRMYPLILRFPSDFSYLNGYLRIIWESTFLEFLRRSGSSLVSNL